MVGRARRCLQALVNSYGETVFVSGVLPGAILLACTFVNPAVGLSGLMCVFAAFGFAAFIGMREEFLRTGFYTYNPLLVGLALGNLFQLGPLTIFLIVTAGVLTFVVTLGASSLMWRALRLPPLSVPFVLVGALCYLASRSYSNLYVKSIYTHEGMNWPTEMLPLWLAGLARCVGAFFFTPMVLPGLVILGLLLAFSRILFFLTLAGYFVGVGITAAMTGSYAGACTDLYAFNYVLIALALGGIFLVPGPRSYITAGLAVAVSPFLLESARVIGAQFGIPVFTLPFNVVTLGFLYALGLVGYPYLAVLPLAKPEATLDHFLSYQTRFPGTFRGITLPFSGVWQVWQGVDGPWTHKGIWRHAFDFVIADSEGDFHRADGSLLEHYHAYGKPVLAPVSGRVVHAVDGIKDNRPGRHNRDANWGNVVVISDRRGFHVVLAHLAQGSLTCREGDWLERGQEVGSCGNSGYSPQPHLHVHVQAEPTPGATTLPFSFTHYKLMPLTGPPDYVANALPITDDRVFPLVQDHALDRAATLLLDEELVFAMAWKGRNTEERMKVGMTPAGEYYLAQGRDKLHFDKRDDTWYAIRLEGNAPALRALFLALPRLPLTYDSEIRWQDRLPLAIALPGWRGSLALFACSFAHRLLDVTGTWSFAGPNEVQGHITIGKGNRTLATRVRLAADQGILAVEVTGTDESIILSRKET